MLLSEFGLNKRTLNALEKKKIFTTHDIERYLPYRYMDYRECHSITESIGKDVAIEIYVESVGKPQNAVPPQIVMEALDVNSGEKVKVKWYGNTYIYDRIKTMPFKEVVVCGKVDYHNKYGYSITNPSFCRLKSLHEAKIYPVYRKMKGVSEETLKLLIKRVLENVIDPIPDEINIRTKLPTYKNALENLHYPTNPDDIVNAKHKLIFNDMLYFTTKIKQMDNEMRAIKTPFKAEKTLCMDEFLHSLPYKLTTDQENTISDITNHMKNGDRVNALVQGDVGCGKTTVAMASMLCMAENGYQSALLVPSIALAQQHYVDVSSMAKRYGMHAVLLTSDLKAKEKKNILGKIKDGSANFIIGTHSLFSETVEYSSLGLAVIDEEHKFGVEQRNSMTQKAIYKEESTAGIHTILMSATPIPRTMAEIKYGASRMLYNIHTMPSGRIPVQTAINHSDKIIFDFLQRELCKGHQCYVICPLVEDSILSEEEVAAGKTKIELDSVEETTKKYADFFEPLGYRVASVTGKDNKTYLKETLNAFHDNKIQILVSTTVIEVGVNVPNASTIIIHNAERFGLAQMHQLRGRVGRGKERSFCILYSTDKENERLKKMVATTDGFEIAEADIQLRGAGDILGTSQNGSNYYTELVMSMPNLYQHIKRYADWMIKFGHSKQLIEHYEKDNQQLAELEMSKKVKAAG